MNKLTDKQLIAISIGVAAVGFIVSLFKLEDGIIPIQYFSYLCYAVAIIAITIFGVRTLKDENVESTDNNEGTLFQKINNALSDTEDKPKNKKMTTCKVCGKEIAKTAKTCPNCGGKTTAANMNQLAGSLIAIIMLVVIIVSCLAIRSLLEYTTSSISNTSTNTTQSENSDTVIFEDAYIKASYIRIYSTDIVQGVLYLQLRIENKSSQEITVALNNASVNKMQTTIGSGMPMTIQSGNSSKQPFMVFTQNLDVQSVDDIKNISFSFYLLDKNMNNIEDTENVTINF